MIPRKFLTEINSEHEIATNKDKDFWHTISSAIRNKIDLLVSKTHDTFVDSGFYHETLTKSLAGRS